MAEKLRNYSEKISKNVGDNNSNNNSDNNNVPIEVSEWVHNHNVLSGLGIVIIQVPCMIFNGYS